MARYDLAMIHQVLRIGSWVVDFLFATKRYDIDGILGCLYDTGAPEWAIEQALELMQGCSYNCGFTFSNENRHRAIVLIGPATSGEEFIDSFVHETHHLAVAIAASIGIDLESETPAYIAGDSARALADVICELGCPHCHNKTRQSED